MDVNVIINELPRDISVDHPSKEKIPLPPDKKFHIFFSYRDTQRDKLWVKRVIDKLEIEYGYTCCDHERDFLPGTKIMDNIKDGVKNSEKVVVVFSKEAIDSHYVLLEAEMAYKLSLEKRKNIVIPVLLDDCAVPEEYMILTYIDAREGVEETTWWPKLLKSLESTEKSTMPPFHVEENSVAVDKTFAVNHLCSIETHYNYRRRCIQPNSKYLPAELQSEAIGVPVDIIRSTYKDLLQSPRVLCRQKCWLFAIIGILLGLLGYLSSFIIFVVSFCIQFPPCTIRAEFYFWVGFFIVFPVCCFFGCKMCYLKNPSRVNKNVIEHNKILSKYGVFVTVVYSRMWKSASLIFYTCKFELCKEYVIRHLAKEESTDTTEYTDIPHSGQMVAPVDDLPLLSGNMEPSRSREQVDSTGQRVHAVSQPQVNSCYLGTDDESHDRATRINAEGDRAQSVQNVNAISQVMPEEIEDVVDDEPLLSIQETENLDHESKALDMLLSCTPEYFALAYAKKLKNPKEDRHGIEFLCLCQYLEKVDKEFRKKVKTMQTLRCKSNIEENYENNKHLKNILLY